MSLSEKCIPLGHDFQANISTQDSKCCIHFDIKYAVKGFHWKDFLLVFGMEQHSDFLHLLKQFNAETIPLRGVGFGDAYYIEASQVEDFLQAVRQIVADYFSPISANISPKSQRG